MSQLDFFTSIQDDSSTEFTVSTFLDHILERIGTEDFVITGEISSLSVRGSNNFITLTDPDDGSQLNCYCHESRLYGVQNTIREGVEVKIVCKPSIYKPYGKFSVNISSITPVGEGELKKAYEELKAKLEGEGYFDSSSKQPTPKYPTHIGLITSQTAAAKTDFLKHLVNRGLQVSFMDARVEGAFAAGEICTAIRRFNEMQGGPEVIVVTRGGGSLESLQAFNTLDVAKAIFASKIPIISAIGHEQDILISDLVADLRASTPTDAAKILSSAWVEADTIVNHRFEMMLGSFQRELRHYQDSVERAYQFQSGAVRGVIDGLNNQLDGVLRAVSEQIQTRIESLSNEILAQERLLLSNDPTKKLKQGYALVSRSGGKVLKSVNDVSPDEEIEISLLDGKISSIVNSIKSSG